MTDFEDVSLEDAMCAGYEHEHPDYIVSGCEPELNDNWYDDQYELGE
jgi:hypothetical protein